MLLKPQFQASSRSPVHRVIEAAGQIILGKEAQIRLALACVLARGHLLIEDLPGVGKTTLAHVLAKTLGLDPDGPEGPLFWKSRASDMKFIIDHGSSLLSDTQMRRPRMGFPAIVSRRGRRGCRRLVHHSGVLFAHQV